MIVRLWKGQAARARRAAYPEHFRTAVAPELRRCEGFLGAKLLTRDVGDAVEFLVLTRWTSIEAIRAFATGDVSNAVVEPGAIAALDTYDNEVQHYEVLEELGQD